MGAQQDPGEPPGEHGDPDVRADDVLTLSRLAAKRGAVRAILDWLARRTQGVATLLDTDGTPATTPAPPPSPALRAAARAVVGLHRRGTPSAVLSGPAAHDVPGAEPPGPGAPYPVDAAPEAAADRPRAGGADRSTVFLVSLAPGGGQGEDAHRRPPPYLVLITPERPGPRSGRPHVLLSDAARTLGLCWRLEEAERDRARVEAAEAHSREAVLHLLMVGSVPAAHRIAAVMRPPLPQLAYVYVIECPGQRRYEIADRIALAARGKAWIVPCPVRPTHLIALVPATGERAAERTAAGAAQGVPDGAAGGQVPPLRPGRPAGGPAAEPGAVLSPPDGDCAADFRATFGELPPAPAALGRSPRGRVVDDAVAVRGLDRDIAERVPECLIGVSGEVPLRETPIGYEQAFHALAVARTAPSGRASFQGDSDLSPLAGPQGARWAQELLAPCLEYVPPRRADPGGDELLGTLGSWLTFGSAASRHLKIHRNTLAARVRLIDELLGLDLGRLADQSAAWLALQLRAVRVPAAGGQPTPTLDSLLGTPAVEVWAQARLQPLERAKLPSGTETVRAWLRADAKLPQAASALGISLPGARKRLTRAEEALGRSLLHAPSAKHELWLAMRALGAL